jgi:hypothetical protein
LVVAAKWAEYYKAADKDFAAKKNAAQIAEHYAPNEKFQTALENKTLNPFETHHNLMTVCACMLGYYWLPAVPAG